MKKLSLILALIIAVPAHGQTYRLPANELPITYLKRLQIDDPSRQLSDRERGELVRLFVDSFITSVRKYKQDYLLEPNTPVYRLLKANFPGLSEREGEGGIFLGAIMRFFNRMPAYKPLVERELREGVQGKKPCQQ